MTFCTYYNAQTCRSCQLLESEYQLQLEQKQTALEEAIHFKPMTPVASPVQDFRHKAKLVVTGSVQEPVIGLAGEDDLDLGREILNCPLHHPRINEVLASLKSFIQEANLPPYQIQERKGELKGLILFYSAASNQGYLRFVLRSKEALDRIKKRLPALVQNHPFLTCITANIQPTPHALLEGPEEIFFTEANSISHRIENLTLDLDPRAFVQTNETIAKALYSTAAEWIKELKPKKFSELYAGQGAFSLMAAGSYAEGLSFEINPEAVKTANHTARKHQANHLSFECRDAIHIQKEIAAYSPDLILVNPPRRGLADSARWLAESGAKYIIYSSCSYETLGKDLDVMKDKYQPKKAQMFDMFPHTKHFETLVLLERKD